METESGGKAAALALCRQWEDLLEAEGLSAEVHYRIGKMMSRTLPVVDKMFPKTVKGQELISQCYDMTSDLRKHLNDEGADVYRLLTALEQIYDDFLRKTYEFRVKAG